MYPQMNKQINDYKVGANFLEEQMSKLYIILLLHDILNRGHSWLLPKQMNFIRIEHWFIENVKIILKYISQGE